MEEVEGIGNFVSASRLQDGSTTFVWKEDVNATGKKIAMPSQITLSIPVFENGAPYSIDARIKYRVKDGVLKIWYELVRPHTVLEAAFRAIWSQIEDQTTTKSARLARVTGPRRLIDAVCV